MYSSRIKLKDKSTLTKVEYLFDHLLFGCIFAYDIYNILPLIVPIAKYNNSISRLIICMLLTSLFGIISSFSYNRRGRGVVEDILAGMGLYTIFTVGEYTPGIVNILFLITIVATFWGIIIIATRKVKKKSRLKQILLSRFLRSTQMVRRNVGIAAAVAIVALPIGLNCFKNEKLNKDYYEKVCKEYGLNAEDIQGGIGVSQYEGDLTVYEAYGDEYRLSENIDTIKLIRDNDTFQSLDYNKKCEVLEAVIYCEARYLGLCKLNVEFKELEDDLLLGTYNHITKTITINSKPIKDGSLPGGTSEELLITVLHECRHCYQNLLSEMYMQATPEQRNLIAFKGQGVSDWITNLGDYKTSVESIEDQIEYCTQPIELDADSFSKTEAEIYYYEIDRYLEEADCE